MVMVVLTSLSNIHAQVIYGDSLPTVLVIGDVDMVSTVYGNDSISSSILEQSSTLVDALRRSKAVYVKDYGPGNIANVVMRGGAAQHTSVYWNGMLINSPTLGATDISLIPSVFINRVQIFPGASGLLNGNGGLSGGIQLSSNPKKGSPLLVLSEKISPSLGEVETSVVWNHSQKNWSLRTAAFNHKADNRFNYIDDSHAEPQNLKRENAVNEGRGIAQNLVVDLNERLSLNLHGQYLGMKREISSPIGIPNRDERQKDEVLRIMSGVKYMGDYSLHDMSFGYTNDGQRYEAPLSELISDIHSERVYARYQFQHQISPNTVIRSRLDHYSTSAKVNQEDERLMRETGLYGEIEHRKGKDIRVNFSGRMEIDGPSPNPFTASLGIEHEISSWPGLKVNWSAAKNFRNPTMNDLYWPELGDPDLKSENGYTTDFVLSLDKKKSQYKGGLFYSEMNQLITWIPGQDGRFRPVNMDEARNYGIELTYGVVFCPRQSFNLGYTLLKSEVNDAQDEGWINRIYQPKHQVQFSYNYGVVSSRVGVNFQYISSVQTDYSSHADDKRLQEIYLCDLVYNWSPPNGDGKIAFGLEVKNLLDVNYQYVKDRPIPGRYLQIKLIFKLDAKE